MAIASAEAALPAPGTPFHIDDRTYLVGDAVDRWGLDHFPAGTTLTDGDGSGRVWTKVVDGRSGWTAPGYPEPQHLAEDFNRLRSFPDFKAEWTFAKYRAAFAEAVRAVASRYSDTHRALADEILDRLGVNEPILGTPVFYRTPGKRGDIAVFGEPDKERFTIFRHDGTDWVKAHGYYDSMKDAGQCRLVSSSQAKTEIDDEAEIARFKDAVWAAGQEAKQQHQWCSAYDKVLAEFDIVDPEPHPDFSPWPDLVKGTEARASLPEGAVLGVDRGDWGIFCKEDGEWVRKAGTRPLAAGTMRLMSPGGGACVQNADGLKPFLPDAVFDGDTLVAWS